MNELAGATQSAAPKTFHSIYRHGFMRMAVGIPRVRVGQPFYNAEQIIGLAKRASDVRATVVLFPELGISGYSNEDLFHQDALLDATSEAVRSIMEASRQMVPILVVGAPLRLEGKLFNCALANEWSSYRQHLQQLVRNCRGGSPE